MPTPKPKEGDEAKTIVANPKSMIWILLPKHIVANPNPKDRDEANPVLPTKKPKDGDEAKHLVGNPLLPTKKPKDGYKAKHLVGNPLLPTRKAKRWR